MGSGGIYLDYQATTPCDPRVVEAMVPWFSEHFGNAASRTHQWGRDAKRAVDLARRQVAERIGASPREIIFTSGATESNNLAIFGTLRANRDRGDHFVTVATEHKAVLDAAAQAEREGFRTTIVGVRPDGLVDLDELEQALDERTTLVSVMWANNEIGTIQPMQEIAAICRGRGVPLHTDAAQALSTLPIDVGKTPVSMMSLSAHKAYGPKGVGALYVREGDGAPRLDPVIFGGGHEGGLRSGTLPVPLLVGFGKAAEVIEREERGSLARLRDRLLDGIAQLGGVHINGTMERRLPHNLNLRIEGVQAEALMMSCPSLGMSSGSACTSSTIAPSHVLLAIGASEEQAECSVRLSVGRFTSAEDIENAAGMLRDAVQRLRG